MGIYSWVSKLFNIGKLINTISDWYLTPPSTFPLRCLNRYLRLFSASNCSVLNPWTHVKLFFYHTPYPIMKSCSLQRPNVSRTYHFISLHPAITIFSHRDFLNSPLAGLPTCPSFQLFNTVVGIILFYNFSQIMPVLCS